MKIIISEQQLKSLLFESPYSEERLNYLLDKINAVGLNSLTDQEKQTLNNISQGKEDESDQESTHNDSHDDPRDDEDSYAMQDDGATFDKAISPEYLDPSDPDKINTKGEPVNLLSMFMYFTPEYEELNINEAIWHVEAHEEYLHVANAENDFYVTPFWESENSVTIETNDGKTNKFKLNNVPSNEKEMKQFVRSFYSHILPKIIKTVVH